MGGGGKGAGFSWWWLLTPVLATGVWLEFSHPIAEYTPPTVQLRDSGQKPVNKPGFLFPAKETLNQIETRPLFTATRRPPEPPAAHEENPGKASQPANLKKYLLTAVVITDDRRLAIFRDTSTGSFFRRSEGGEIDGWLVEGVLPDEVVVSKEGVTERLGLRRYRPPPLSARAAKPKKKGRRALPAIKEQKGSLPKQPRRRLNTKVTGGKLTGPESVNGRRKQRPLRGVR